MTPRNDEQEAPAPPHSAEAFAALQHIEAGDWDRFLLRLRAAIRHRLETDGYKSHIVAGGGHASHPRRV